MKQSAIIVGISTTLLCLTSCAVFKIGSSNNGPLPIERSQRSSESVIHLWKAELDSNNTRAAAELMVHTTGRPLLALEKYELADDLQRWRKVISFPITSSIIDTLSSSQHNVSIVLNYYRKLHFSTQKVQDLWFISRVRQ